MAATLYKRQKQILDYIKQYIEKNDCAPTLKEIADHFDLSSLATVHAHLTRLEEKGYLQRDFHGERGMRVTDPSEGLLFRDVVDVPLVGEISAGAPIMAVEEDSGTLPIPADLVGNRNVYCLRVKGDSMIESLIMNGDYVVVEKTDYVAEGDTVVALLDDGSATVKKFFRDKDRSLIRLQPANPAYEPLFVDSVVIQGRVIGVFRQY
jgi:repressor LexA